MECEVERRKQIAAESREKDVQLAQRTAELARSKRDAAKKQQGLEILGAAARANAHAVSALPALYRAEAKAQRYAP